MFAIIFIINTTETEQTDQPTRHKPLEPPDINLIEIFHIIPYFIYNVFIINITIKNSSISSIAINTQRPSNVDRKAAALFSHRNRPNKHVG